MNDYLLCKDGIAFKRFTGKEVLSEDGLHTCILAPLWLEEHLSVGDVIVTPDKAAAIVFLWEKAVEDERLLIHCA